MVKPKIFPRFEYAIQNHHIKIERLKVIHFSRFCSLSSKGTKGAEVTQPDYQHLLDLEKLFVLHVLFFVFFLAGQLGLYLQK